jgi:hypothetical protein
MRVLEVRLAMVRVAQAEKEEVVAAKKQHGGDSRNSMGTIGKAPGSLQVKASFTSEMHTISAHSCILIGADSGEDKACFGDDIEPHFWVRASLF